MIWRAIKWPFVAPLYYATFRMVPKFKLYVLGRDK